MTPWIIGGSVAFILLSPFLLWYTFVVSAAPDEWLLRLRNGKLIDSGVGVRMFWRPGDIFVRFSSTMQRVGFKVETLTSDRINVVIRGFILWAVSSEAEAPFQAFRALGLANLLKPPRDLRHPKHLLTGPQHKVFQQMITGSAQRYASKLTLEDLISDQDAYVSGLTERLEEMVGKMGVALEQVEVLETRPADPEVLEALCVRENERIREEAAAVRLDASERIEQRERSKKTRETKEDAEAKRDRQAHQARTLLELEQQRAKLFEEQEKVRIQKLDSEAAMTEKEAALRHEQKRRDEERLTEILSKRLERQQNEFEARVAKIREEAKANRDAEIAGVEVLIHTPQDVRDFKLSRLTLQKLSESLKITEGRWVTVNQDSPLAGFKTLLEGAKELLDQKPHEESS